MHLRVDEYHVASLKIYTEGINRVKDINMFLTIIAFLPRRIGCFPVINADLEGLQRGRA